MLVLLFFLAVLAVPGLRALCAFARCPGELLLGCVRGALAITARMAAIGPHCIIGDVGAALLSCGARCPRPTRFMCLRTMSGRIASGLRSRRARDHCANGGNRSALYYR